MNATIDTYNKAADAYAQKFNAIGSRRDDIVRAFALFGEKENASVVEWGCGNGRDAAVILEFTHKYIGIDASQAMIKLAVDFLPDAIFRVADIASFESEEGIDIIFAFASLLHFDKKSVKEILAKAYVTLSDRGVVYISLKRAPYEERIVTDEYGSRTFYFYEREDIEELAEELYEIVYYDEQQLRDVDWLIAALKKKSK